MVLWELTLITAYVLGLPRTYRIALRLQRKLLGRHSAASDFTYRRIRGVFGIALRVQTQIQSRDILAGKTLGNWILSFLARMQPSKIVHKVASAKSRKIPRVPSLGEIQNAKYVPPLRAYSKHVGLTFRNRLTVGLDSLKPNFNPSMMPVSSLALKLWWHPVRNIVLSPQQQPSFMLSQSPTQLMYSPSPLNNACGGTRSVFRNDILLWMQPSAK